MKGYEDLSYYESSMMPNVEIKETSAQEQYELVKQQLVNNHVGIYSFSNYDNTKFTGVTRCVEEMAISGEIIEADGTFRAYTAEENYTRSLHSRSDYIPCNANTNYYFENVMPLSVAYTVGCYDENKQFLRKLSFSGNSATVSGVLNTGDNTKYMVVCYKTTNVDTVMVAKSDTATEYEPYTETVAEIDLSEPLYEGDYIEYRADGSGVLHRSMCGAVFDGSDDEGWGKSATTGTNRYYVYINDIFASSDCNLLCSQAIRVNNTSTTANSVAFVTPAKQFAINTEFSTLEEWKAWLAENPIKVVYELATPTEIELTAEQVEQFKQLYTFEPVTNVFCDGEVELLYYKNTDNGETVGMLQEQTKVVQEHLANTTVHITATERTNLNDANSKKHTHSNKSILDNTTASYTTNEQTKLSGIATGAEVNQNAFSNVVVGSTTISADSKTDSLTLVAGSNVTITPDATNDKITISSSHPTISKSTNTTSTASPSAGGTFTAIDSITQDSNGHVTKFNTKTVTLPSTSITVDSALSSTSTNPVQNKVINTALAGKANSSHGTHVTYSTTKPVMDGTASVGTATTVARSDHKHPTDTSRASTSSVLSTVSECTASTNSTDIASASALAELNNSLTTKQECGGYNTIENVSDFSYTVKEDGVYIVTLSATALTDQGMMNLLKNGVQCSPMCDVTRAYQILQCTIVEKLSIGDVITAWSQYVGSYTARRIYYSVVKL